MTSANGFIAMTAGEFAGWLADLKVSRSITRIQIHHTYQPGYREWAKKPDALYWQRSMRDYHISSAGFSDIAQQLTICPDGTIVTGRSFNTAPAGITGANTGAVCIENLGNFDKGKDTMTDIQHDTIIAVVGELLKKFGLGTEAITYHAWWTASGTPLGTYIASRSAKTCPGTGFFGGNTREAFENGFKKRVEEYMKGEMIDMEELNKLKAELAAMNVKYDTVINRMGREISELRARTADKMIYDYIDDNMPEWAHEGVRYCVDNGIIKGTGEGKLGLDDKDLKYCTMIMRMMKK